jgi:hypothetical protein
MWKLTLTKSLEFVEDTGGAYKYQEVDSLGAPIRNDEDGATFRDLYIRKVAIPGAAPKKIIVRVEFDV